MKSYVLVVTLITVVMLIPVAILMDDLLVLSLAGLFPLYVDWKNGDLN